MKTAVLMLCILGFASLFAGSVSAGIQHSICIPTRGTILPYRDGSVSQAVGAQTNLDKVNSLTILSSIGFFAAGFAINRKRN